MELSPDETSRFSEALWGYYAGHGRGELPWRQPEPDGDLDPYKIMVSELMLQQTQVNRVIPKYHAFLGQFPTVEALATATLGDVLRAWQGLGYNRRAKFLWLAAQQIHAAGDFPHAVEGLVGLPGIGANTAGAIMAYAYNSPVVFIETNIRTVYIHHFFADRTDVHDKELKDVLRQTLAWEEGKEQPQNMPATYSVGTREPRLPKTAGLSYRDFYWALMDYGTYLKATVGNLSRVSKHFTKQSTFHGSRRQLRGQVIRALGATPMSAAELTAVYPDERMESVLQGLTAEGLIRQTADVYSLD